MVCYNTELKKTLGWEVFIDQCGKRRGLVLHSCIVSHSVVITSREVLLMALVPDKKKPDEYSRLSIPLSDKGEEVHFG
jgi:hypothetical protein